MLTRGLELDDVILMLSIMVHDEKCRVDRKPQSMMGNYSSAVFYTYLWDDIYDACNLLGLNPGVTVMRVDII